MGTAPTHQQFKNQPEDFDFCDSELVIAFVCAVGTDYGPIRAAVEEILGRYGYKANVIRVSDLIQTLMDVDLVEEPETARISSRMDAGNAGCRETGRRDLWALATIAKINGARSRDIANIQPIPRTAHLIFSLKRPEEAATLRKVYEEGFYLVGVFATEKERTDFLIQKNAPKNAAEDLIKRDALETSDEFGQQTTATFHLSDVFVQLRGGAYRNELERFFRILFCDPYETPTQREHAMFLACASSLRSAQLSRQVGAAITTREGDVLAVGCNDVPKAGGGLYWPSKSDKRDHNLGFDTNDSQRDKIVSQLLEQVPGIDDKNNLRAKFRTILDITEYGRAVHAEMDALLTCARSGVSPKGAILYTTTFPCHNCTRHIIAAGIQRVIYIEPYAKSRAEELHEDAIVVEEKAKDSERIRHKVPFTHFVGIGPRRYFDLFSLTLSSGHELIRKQNGKVIEIVTKNAWPRVPMSPYSYMIREALAIRQLDSLPRQLTFDLETLDDAGNQEQEH